MFSFFSRCSWVSLGVLEVTLDYRGPVFYARPSKTWGWGGGAYRLVYGGKGEVTGPATSKTAKGKGVRVQFPAGNSTPLGCLLT